MEHIVIWDGIEIIGFIVGNGGARGRIRINLPVGYRTEHQAENTSEKAQEG